MISNSQEHSAMLFITLKLKTRIMFKGVKKVDVDGKEYEGCLIPFEESRKRDYVTVYMG